MRLASAEGMDRMICMLTGKGEGRDALELVGELRGVA